MDISIHFIIKKAKFTLAFFCFVCFISSQANSYELNPSVLYANNKAQAVFFTMPKRTDAIKVYLKGSSVPVLGEIEYFKNQYVFTPVVAFSNGKQYRIEILNQTLATFSIPEQKETLPPELLTIYPTAGIVPENLLKMYFVFSKPMQEVGKWSDFIKVFNQATRKEVDIFLDLETELWNKEHTILTLWLDPGRIKTGLIPNQEKGLPLVEGNEYSISISTLWKDASGVALEKGYTKKLHAIQRDAKIPSVEEWKVTTQTFQTGSIISINFGESLDGILAQETIQILNAKKEQVLGVFELKNNEKILNFQLKHTLEKGPYTIVVESRLEDLAGNNLNRLFDVDLESDFSGEPSATKTLGFLVE